MSTSDADLDRFSAQAEQVREHLVSLRGGAPFLSPFDARQLLDWLEAGVSVGAILQSLEQAADKRRQKRSHVPLSLRHARAGVKAALKLGLRPEASLEPLIEALLQDPGSIERAVGERLAALTERGDALIEAAIAEQRWGLRQAWEQADQAALLAQADRELEGIGAEWTPAQRDQAREEVARDLTRRAHPLLSAACVWDTLSP